MWQLQYVQVWTEVRVDVKAFFIFNWHYMLYVYLWAILHAYLYNIVLVQYIILYINSFCIVALPDSQRFPWYHARLAPLFPWTIFVASLPPLKGQLTVLCHPKRQTHPGVNRVCSGLGCSWLRTLGCLLQSNALPLSHLFSHRLACLVTSQSQMTIIALNISSSCS